MPIHAQGMNQTTEPQNTAPILEKPVTTQPVAANVKRIIAIVAGVILILILSILPVFAGSSLLSRGLDLVGAHKAAFGVDRISSALVPQSNSNNILQFDIEKIANSLSGDKSCVSVWDDIKNKSAKVESADITTGGTVSLLDTENKELIALGAQVSAQSDVHAVEAGVSARARAKVDSSAIVTVLKAFDKTADFSSFDQGIVTAEAQAKSISTLDSMTFALSDLKINAKSVNFDESLKNSGKSGDEQYAWYGDKTKLDDTQKKAAHDIASSVQSLLATKPSNALNDETGKQIAKLICSGTENIQIGAVGNYKIGDDAFANTINARKVSVKAQNKSYTELTKIANNNLNSVINSLKKDQTLRTWLKAQYQTFKSISDNAAIIDKSVPNYSSDLKSQDTWNTSVDKNLDSLSEQANSADTEQYITQIFDVIDVVVEKNDLYFNTAGEIVGADNTVSLKLKDGAAGTIGLSAQTPAEVVAFLKSKIVINTFISKVSISNSVLSDDTIKTPATYKSPNDLTGDLENKDSVKKLKTDIQPLVDAFTGIFGTLFGGGASTGQMYAPSSDSSLSLPDTAIPMGALDPAALTQ